MIQAALHKVWYGDRRPGPLLGMLESIYRRLARSQRRRQLARRCLDLEQWPIIVVGNITAGGAGKTPLVIRLCELLVHDGMKPGVVSRGYGRKGRGQKFVGPGSTASEVGDEPLLVARRCGVPVVVDEDREAAVRALADLGIDAVISDDGLQRWRLPRDMEICVMDAQRGFGNGRLLPAGPLREPLARLESVDFLVSNGGPPAQPPGHECIPMRLEAGAFTAIGRDENLTADAFRGHVGNRPVHAVAGIAFPQRFFDLLGELDIKVCEMHRFDDHHSYRIEDFGSMQGVVVMTEKDAVKCMDFQLPDAWYLPVSASLPLAWEREFADRVAALVEEKRK